jgi:hypothetical protein
MRQIAIAKSADRGVFARQHHLKYRGRISISASAQWRIIWHLCAIASYVGDQLDKS